MRKIIAFYAWQSDTSRKFNRDLIDIALKDAAKRITEDPSLAVEVQIDSDTQGVPGTPPITETILKKIVDSDLFVPDVTFVARTENGKLVPNPNVMTEFGYALHAKSHSGMMPVMNTAFGSPEDLPFDMGHLRHPIQYRLEATANDTERRGVRDALSREFEEKLRLQIKATQPPPPLPAAFPRAQAKDGPARFRAQAEPIGKHSSDLLLPKPPSQDVSLLSGPALYLRLMPAVNPGRTWPVYELRKHAMSEGQFPLAPFVWDNIFSLRAEDGYGHCTLATPDATETSSVAFAFETGEVWGVDTRLLALDKTRLLVGEIEKLYAERLFGYGQFLASLGLQAPYHWVCGITDVKGRHLAIPVQPRHRSNPTFTGPECLSSNIIWEGTYDGAQSPANSLVSFFSLIFDKSGVRRSDYGLADI
jgi:hypothetical protein